MYESEKTIGDIRNNTGDSGSRPSSAGDVLSEATVLRANSRGGVVSLILDGVYDKYSVLGMNVMNGSRISYLPK